VTGVGRLSTKGLYRNGKENGREWIGMVRRGVEGDRTLWKGRE